MIRHIWSVLCSRSVIDIESNNISIQNVIEQLNIEDEPKPDGLLMIDFEVVSFWDREDLKIPQTGTAKINFETPSGVTNELMTYPVDLSRSERSRTRVKTRGIPAREPGRHHFHVFIKNEEDDEFHKVSSVPLTIVFNSGTKISKEGEHETRDTSG